MKKLTMILGVLLSLGACMLTPLTPPPPAMDWSDPTNAGLREDLITEIGDLEIVDSSGLPVPIKVADDGTLSIPVSAVPDEFKDLLPVVDGELVLELHSIVVQADGSKQIVYKNGDSYIAAVYKDGVLSIKNSPTIDYGTIDWDSEGIFNTVKP